TGTVTGTYQWDVSYSGDTNNSTASDNNAKNEQVVVSPASPKINTTPSATTTATGGGAFATIGFWHNKNGQAVIKNFDSGPCSALLGNSLASNYANLFGYANPYDSASLAASPGSPPGLAGLTNAQIASVYLNLWT